MEKKNEDYFERAKIGLFFKLLAIDLKILSAITLVIGVLILAIRWSVAGMVPYLTEEDIADLTRMSVHYRISGWWELLFFWLEGVILYFFASSRYLKEKVGKKMRTIFLLLVVSIGVYFAVIYHGILYGLIVTAVITALPPSLLFIHWLSRRDD